MGWIEYCQKSCKAVKFLNEEIVWEERPNHSGWLQATSTVLDLNHTTIPNLYFKGEFAPSPRGDRVSYGLMYRHGRDVRRVFMLEIYPAHVRSHIGTGVQIFGPHIHLGDERFEQVTKAVLANIDKATANRWIEKFQRHARISSYGSAIFTQPIEGDLFA